MMYKKTYKSNCGHRVKEAQIGTTSKGNATKESDMMSMTHTMTTGMITDAKANHANILTKTSPFTDGTAHCWH